MAATAGPVWTQYHGGHHCGARVGKFTGTVAAATSGMDLLFSQPTHYFLLPSHLPDSLPLPLSGHMSLGFPPLTASLWGKSSWPVGWLLLDQAGLSCAVAIARTAGWFSWLLALLCQAEMVVAAGLFPSEPTSIKVHAMEGQWKEHFHGLFQPPSPLLPTHTFALQKTRPGRFGNIVVVAQQPPTAIKSNKSNKLRVQ